MADQSDVENALVSYAASACYPSGTGQPSVVNHPIKIYRGWPGAAELDADLRERKIHISVYAHSGLEQTTTRYPMRWQEVSRATNTLTVTKSGTSFVFSGQPLTPCNISMKDNNGVRVYAVQTNDTLASIASACAALVGGTSSGAGFVFDGDVRTGVTGLLSRELRRQQRLFQATLWCPTPEVRDQLGTALDREFARANFLMSPDGSASRLTFRGSMSSDEGQKRLLYRKDLLYLVEWATTETMTAAEIVSTQVRT